MGNVRDDMRGLRPEMEILLDNLRILRHSFPVSYRKKWIPSVDVYETGEEIVVAAELAGVARGDVRISVSKNVLCLTGIRRETRVCSRRQYHSMEIRFGPFEKLIPLPTDVRNDEMKVSFENGLLEIRLPKAIRSEDIIVEIE